ncbi:hypothetical protein VE03_09264 [Pseudogymnoascus sp. 23342-1-I1]|nr:hypothetical protein VE03_09264 [Pseudogymnoascus sp. 23342-1-I1]
MDQLPTELVRAIANIVDRKDILSFRLTCRYFAALGLPRQFEVIPVMLFRNSLENLRRISENPIYRNYVLTIEYGMETVSDPGGHIEWACSTTTFRGIFETDVIHAYGNHEWYYEEQKRMMATGYDFEVLQSAVSCLPNLRGVRIISSNPENINRFQNPPLAWGDDFSDVANILGDPELFYELGRPSSARGITAILAACKLAPKALSWFECEAFEPSILGYDDGESDTEDFMLGSIPLSTLANFVRDPTEDLGPPLVCATFENLTSLKLQFTLGSMEDRSGLWQEGLGTALRGAQGLETLYMEEDSERYGGGVYSFAFAPILGSHTWPHLTHLSLFGIIIHEHDLPAFFARHPSLHTFTLGSAYAADFDWAILLQSESLAPRWRQLRSLTLDGYWGAKNWSEPLHEPESYEDYDVEEKLDHEVCLYTEFEQWAQDLLGARDLRELLERYYSSAYGEAPFPLRTRQETEAEVVNRTKNGKWTMSSGSSDMIIATESSKSWLADWVTKKLTKKRIHQILDSGICAHICQFGSKSARKYASKLTTMGGLANQA